MFYGFLGTHQPAVWMGESAQVSVAPGIGEVKTAFADRGLIYSHEKEISTPHYYKNTVLSASGDEINVELTATSRVGVMKFSFNGIVIDDNRLKNVVVQATRDNIAGKCIYSNKSPSSSAQEQNI